MESLFIINHNVLLYTCVALFMISCILIFYLSYIKRVIQRKFEVDHFTGLLNKAGFERQSAQRLQHEQKKSFLVDIYVECFGIFCAINGFKAGQNLRASTAKILNKLQVNGALWSRYDDEHYFGLLSVEDKKEAMQYIQTFKQHLRDCEWESNRVVKYKFAIYEIDDISVPVDEMIGCLRATMHHVISHHYNAIEILDIGVQTYEGLQRALTEEELLVYIQPQYRSDDSSMIGGEALIRWMHPVKGFLPPDEFIPLFEMHGLIIDLDYYVLDCVCKMLRECIDRKFTVVPIAVNFSRVHLFDSDFVDNLKETLYAYNIEEKLIKIEFTETEIVNDTNYAFMKSQIERLHTLGFHVELDDFGSGCTSLDMVCNLSFDVLKLDKGFLKGMQTSVSRQKIIQSIIQMAHDLEISTVAEGVETEEQFNYLRKLNCDYIQGYYFQPPLQIQEFTKLLTINEERSTFLDKNSK